MRDINTHKNYLKLASISGYALMSALASTSMASAQLQTSEIVQGEDGNDEIIVTVERRSQSLQDYAGTAAAISGEELKLLGIGNINELDGKIPGLSIANSQGNIEVYIRGVGSSNNTELGDPAAATHLNGVYVPRPSGFGAAFFDIERVEVNIGPQGTLRGRNATAGSVNIIPWGPGIGQKDAAIEASYGNFDDYRIEGVVNLPVTENSAFRLSAFVGGHDSYLNNVTPNSSEIDGVDVPTSEEEGVGVAEAADDFGIRAAYKIEATDKLTLTLTGDYVEQKGTGYTGVNFANPLGNGIDPDDIDNPRDVLGRAFTPEEDTEHWGVKGQVDYKGDWFNVEYIGSYRDLVYDYEFVTPIAPFYDGVLDTLGPLDFDNFSRVRFITDSESIVQELRLYDDDVSFGPGKLDWTVGGFYFNEDQRTFLGTTGDRNPFFSGVEFNQTTDTESFSAYGDVTFHFPGDKARVSGGLRYTNDTKTRFGVNARYQFITGGAAFAPIGIGQGTEGFEFNGLGRTIFNPDTNSDGNVSTQETLEFFFDSVETFGARDGLDDIFAGLAEIPGDAPPGVRAVCANFATSGPCPIDGVAPFFDEPPIQPASIDGLISFAVLGGNTIALQNGRIDNDFLDWRIRAEYDLTEDHLVYGLISTGNKSGGFNDNIAGTEGLGIATPFAGAPTAFDLDTLAPTYGPETLTLFELGSKNEFKINEVVSGHFNISGFYYDYDDIQLTTLTSTAQIVAVQGIELPEDDLANLGGQIVAFTFNASDAEIYGAQFEGGLDLPGDVNIDATVLWLPVARVVNSQEIQDFRFQADVDAANAVNRSIEGNRLIRTPEVQINASLSKAVDVPTGSIDGIFSAGYRSSQFMTILNGEDFNNPDMPLARLDDSVDGYFTLDAGIGYNHGDDDRWRIEAYVNNLTGIEREQAIIITQFDNTRFFSPPRTYGVRLRAKFK